MSFPEGFPIQGSNLRSVMFTLGFLGIALLLAACASDAPSSSPVPEEASVELVGENFEFTEGPYWYEGRLIFSDIPANTIYQWTPEEGTSVFLEASGHSNGLRTDNQGRLLLAQHDGQIGRLTQNGEVEPLVEEYEGKRLNSPNDLDVASDGSIYFTDPPYGVDEEERELDFSGVYRFSSDSTLTLLTDEFSRPNGICLSPDESRLYVNDSEETFIQVFDVADDGSITNGRRFATPEADEEGSTDGMKVDADGNLYTTGPGGVWIYSPEGELLDRISVPEPPTNLAFGGPDKQTLYITARPNVYRVSVDVSGAE